MTAIPTLETARLVLRAHKLEDFPALAALWADSIVTRFIGGRVSTESQSWLRFLQYAGLWTIKGFGYWAVVEKATGAYVGDVGFAEFKRAIVPPITDTPEVGWVLAPSAHGKGYATEAVGAAVAWGRTRFTPGRAVCIIDPQNLASMRVAEKLGFRAFAQTTFGEDPVVLLELTFA